MEAPLWERVALHCYSSYMKTKRRGRISYLRGFDSWCSIHSDVVFSATLTFQLALKFRSCSDLVTTCILSDAITNGELLVQMWGRIQDLITQTTFWGDLGHRWPQVLRTCIQNGLHAVWVLCDLLYCTPHVLGSLNLPMFPADVCEDTVWLNLSTCLTCQHLAAVWEHFFQVTSSNM